MDSHASEQLQIGSIGGLLFLLSKAAFIFFDQPQSEGGEIGEEEV